ncbi:MAG: leucyl aminopeptidase family protein [Alphaproteobacteria bacterium]|nr:leucyl aminopeptidase family protein [Alphaproteobacteria bacterium]
MDAETRPIWLIGDGDDPAVVLTDAGISPQWLQAATVSPKSKRVALLAGRDGNLAGAALGIGDGKAGEPCGPSDLLIGLLPGVLPAGDYHVANPNAETAELAAVAWGLGAYRFQRYRGNSNGANGANGGKGATPANARLRLPEGIDRARIDAIVEAVWFGRDLINTPASDMGPDDLEAASRLLADRHGGRLAVTSGDELLAKNFPMIHAVGRASDRAPRLIDLTWQPATGGPDLRTVTLVGKGITFDTGGLDLKPAAGMLLMKKDMGGAASALALAHMIMALQLPLRLRVLIAAAENSVAGNAFRPGDVLTSRSGRTVEIGNTDAEGRLVLADALTLGGEAKPDLMISLATLTGAARVALGPDLPAFFTDDEAFAAAVARHGAAIGDPVWRMPFWRGYEARFDSEVADMNNVSDGPFAGAITAALFLRRFAGNARRYAHIDLYGWRPAQTPLGPKGGEPHAARMLLNVLSEEVTT